MAAPALRPPLQNHLHGHDIDGARPWANHELLKILGVEVHAADAGLCPRRRLGWAEGHQAVAALGIPHAHCGIAGSRDNLQSFVGMVACQQPSQLQIPANQTGLGIWLAAVLCSSTSCQALQPPSSTGMAAVEPRRANVTSSQESLS